MVTESQLKSEFSYGNFRSIYSSKYLAENRGTHEFFGGEKEFDRLIEDTTSDTKRFTFPCFGKFQEVLRYAHLKNFKASEDDPNPCKLNEDVELYIVINTDKEKTYDYYQYCWMTVEELIEHINTVKSLFEGFEFSVMKDDFRKFMKVKFLFKKGEITYFKIRFLLTWMRYSYEWAISMSTLDAYRLLKSPVYIPELSKENIFNLVEITNKLTYHNILQDQVICGCGCPEDFEKFKNAVNRETNHSLNGDIYSTQCSSGNFPKLRCVDSVVVVGEGCIKKNRYYSIAWWLDEEAFVTERLPYYKKYLEILKTLYKYEPAK